MTRRRWIADEVSGNRAYLTGNHARHLAQVLRAQVGQQFEVAADNSIRVGTITSIERDRIEFALGDAIAASSLLPISVAMSIFKFDRMEWAIEKCTELGVARIVPLISARTEVRLASAAVKRVERWRRIAREASEQARRVSPPAIGDPVKLKEFMRATKDSTRVVLSEVEESTALKNVIVPENSLTLAFGPEGGWKEQELTAFAENGWQPASLGTTILRSETAVIAAVAIATSLI